MINPIYKPSFTYPDLIIGSDGSVWTNGKKLQNIKNHSHSVPGPVVTIKHNGKHKQVSVVRLVYEAHVKNAPIEKSDYIDYKDGDEFNTKAENLIPGPRYRRKFKETEILAREGYDCWLNGQSELYC